MTIDRRNVLFSLRKVVAIDEQGVPCSADQSVAFDYFSNLKTAIDSLSQAEVVNVAELLRDTRDNGGTIYTMGNGGSGATASHMAGDLNKGASYGRRERFKAMCLNDNYATFAALANDHGYSEVFVEQLKNFLLPGDLVIGFSGSGNSANVVKAIQYARTHGARTLAVTGFDGGRLRDCAEHGFHVAVDDMQICEDLHMVLVHVLLKMLTASQGKNVSDVAV